MAVIRIANTTTIIKSRRISMYLIFLCFFDFNSNISF